MEPSLSLHYSLSLNKPKLEKSNNVFGIDERIKAQGKGISIPHVYTCHLSGVPEDLQLPAL
jgi:hypothetical protein